ncbi:flavoprotein, partial [Cyberlindnera jadinii NRRL Y-1542]
LPQDDGKIHILFGACGSVASAKIRLIVKRLEDIYGKDKLSIQLVLTSAAEHFVSRTDFGPNVFIWRDKDEWSTWKTRTDPVLHIELRRWADILIIAPLTANTLSKVALGICDNLLTNVIRAWNTQYPIVMAPSMVSYAYNSVQTKRHLKTIKEEMPWIEVLKPAEKIIGSYGDIGMGGMMDYNEIVDKIV